MSSSPTLGAWMKHYRAARDLTQEQLAEQVGCAAQTVRMFEIGRRRPSRELAARMIEVLHIPAEEREPFLRIARAAVQSAPAGEVAEPPVNDSAPAGVPHAPNKLIGRQVELEQISSALTSGESRLLTLVGPGGVGKTRLALAVAAESDVRFVHGVVWVALTPLRSVDQVPPAIAEALRLVLPRIGDTLAHLAEALRRHETLLIFDNAEHLLHETAAGEHSLADLIVRLLEAVPRLRVLVTSRERLRVPGEWVIELGGLELPRQSGREAHHAPAVQLFLERAQQIDHRFTLSTENRRAVTRICRTLDGTPLAIELAAAWVKTLSPDEIAAELSRDLDLLAGTEHRHPARHRSLRMIFEHSWNLLTDEEQRVLAGLSVLRGGGDRAAAAAIAGASLPILASLIDKSLVRRFQQPGGAMRYDLHELVRQYASEKLTADPVDDTAVQQRHSAYYADLLQAARPRLQSSIAAQAMAELSAERGNLQAAWLWAVSRYDLPTLRQMVSGLGLLAEMRGWLSDDMDLFKHAVDTLRAAGLAPSPELRATHGTILAWYGRARGRFGDPAAACELLSTAASLLDDDADNLAATGALGYLAMMLAQRGHFREARTIALRNLELTRQRNLPFFVALTSAYLAFITLAQGDLAATRAALAEGRSAAAESNMPRAHTLALCTGAWIENDLGAYETAEQLAREAVPIAALHRDRWGMGWALFQLGRVMLARADLTEAIYLLNESIELFEETGDYWSRSRVQGYLARAERLQGNPSAAKRLMLETLRLVIMRDHVTLVFELIRELAELAADQGDINGALALLDIVLADTRAERYTHDQAYRFHTALIATHTPATADPPSELVREVRMALDRLPHEPLPAAIPDIRRNKN